MRTRANITMTMTMISGLLLMVLKMVDTSLVELFFVTVILMFMTEFIFFAEDANTSLVIAFVRLVPVRQRNSGYGYGDDGGRG